MGTKKMDTASIKPFFLLSLVLLSGGLLGARDSNPIPAVDTIVARMGKARSENRARMRSYSVARNYRLVKGQTQDAQSEVLAEVTFVPPDVKQFVVRHASGMRLGERIVRQMLEYEATAMKNYGLSDLSNENYGFRFLRDEQWNGHPCYVLEISPRRKDRALLQGQVWVDSVTYLVHRIEGAPAKEPSWWIKDARVEFSYGDVGGMWLLTSSESSADVRLLGRHTMLSRDVEYKLGELVAGVDAPGQLSH